MGGCLGVGSGGKPAQRDDLLAVRVSRSEALDVRGMRWVGEILQSTRCVRWASPLESEPSRWTIGTKEMINHV